jgi:hypothetical protein
MALKPAPGSGSTPLTVGQARLIARHRRGILRLAEVLAAKSGVHPNGLMFVLAARQSNIASVIRELFPGAIAVKDTVVVPGLVEELTKWIERLAVSGPVWDCTASSTGIPVLLIDDLDAIALLRFPTI